MRQTRFSFSNAGSFGFTLAELLIAMVILGVIATFTIPKILQTQQDNQRKAVFRETYASISSLINQGRQQGIDPATMRGYIASHLNFVKICPNNLTTDGCWNAAIQGTWPNYSDNAGGILHNGAVLGNIQNDGCCYMGTPGAWCAATLVDWNGVNGPNTDGNDIVGLIYNYGTAPDPNPASWCYNIPPGQIQSWDYPTFDTAIFSN